MQADKEWEVDISALDALVDERTRAILVNNPSNPCGSSYSRAHLVQLVHIADKHHLPIIADEIYGGVVFDGQFVPMHAVCGQVPVLSLGGTAVTLLFQ